MIKEQKKKRLFRLEGSLTRKSFRQSKKKVQKWDFFSRNAKGQSATLSLLLSWSSEDRDAQGSNERWRSLLPSYFSLFSFFFLTRFSFFASLLSPDGSEVPKRLWRGETIPWISPESCLEAFWPWWWRRWFSARIAAYSTTTNEWRWSLNKMN